MNKIVKKSMATVLAGLMAVTSIGAGSISAFAADAPKTATAIAQDTAITVAATQNATTKVWDDTKYYSFTPSVAGTYAISYKTAPVYDTTGKNRQDSASLYIADGFDATTGVYNKELNRYMYSYDSYTTAYDVATDTSTKTYVDGYDTVSLDAGKTYYFKASLSQAKTDSYSTASLSISKTDYASYTVTKSKEVTDKDGDTIDVYTSIGSSAYYVGTSNIVNVPATINNLPVVKVSGTDNKNITSLTLPASVKQVSGFSDCKNLATVNLNAGLETVEGFDNCKALTAITIPASVKTVEESAFKGCTSLATITIQNGVQSIGDSAFYNTAAKLVIVPASVEEIGSMAFGYAEALDDKTVDPNDTYKAPVAGFTIAGTVGTQAQAYAVQNGFGFINTAACTHYWVVTSTKAATLFAKGSKTSTCAVCGAKKTTSITKKTIAVKSVKSSKKATMAVKAAKQSQKITGYQVQYSTSKKFTKKTTKSVKVKTTKALSKTVKGLKSGKKYYVRVRAYKVSGKKTTYGVYGSAKTVKVK